MGNVPRSWAPDLINRRLTEEPIILETIIQRIVTPMTLGEAPAAAEASISAMACALKSRVGSKLKNTVRSALLAADLYSQLRDG
jgi:hypothetical protein